MGYMTLEMKQIGYYSWGTEHGGLCIWSTKPNQSVVYNVHPSGNAHYPDKYGYKM